MRPSVTYAILCNGEFPGHSDVRDALLSSDVVVCCDGAAASFMRFRKPEFVVGDMDSLPGDIREELSDNLFPLGEQESNDLSKAFRWVCSLLGVGSSNPLPDFHITIYGATGKREDHTLGNISLLADFETFLSEKGLSGRVTLVTDYGLFMPLTDSCRLQLPVGQKLSIFAFDRDLTISSTGLEYPTDRVRFDMWWKATLNTVSGQEVTLTFSHPSKVLIYFPDIRNSRPRAYRL